MTDKADDSATAVIEDGHIVIRLPIENLQAALDGAHALGMFTDPVLADANWNVSDPAEFAKDVCCALNYEDEQGTTAVHKMFDSAFAEAIDQGSTGIEEVDADEEDGE